ncbi:hypothetical protein CLO_2053 [Clostridium botulinum E1 str. 'BoNT E Beluga']|nr:hypothetical protein CLO_2053 [Clostridium botulinum E1 str. 'BoNT E Beluga']
MLETTSACTYGPLYRRSVLEDKIISKLIIINIASAFIIIIILKLSPIFFAIGLSLMLFSNKFFNFLYIFSSLLLIRFYLINKILIVF